MDEELRVYDAYYHMDNGKIIHLSFHDTDVDGAFAQATDIYNEGMDKKMVLVDSQSDYWMIIPKNIEMIECRQRSGERNVRMLTNDWFREREEYYMSGQRNI